MYHKRIWNIKTLNIFENPFGILGILHPTVRVKTYQIWRFEKEERNYLTNFGTSPSTPSHKKILFSTKINATTYIWSNKNKNQVPPSMESLCFLFLLAGWLTSASNKLVGNGNWLPLDGGGLLLMYKILSYLNGIAVYEGKNQLYSYKPEVGHF